MPIDRLELVLLLPPLSSGGGGLAAPMGDGSAAGGTPSWGEQLLSMSFSMTIGDAMPENDDDVVAVWVCILERFEADEVRSKALKCASLSPAAPQ